MTEVAGAGNLGAIAGIVGTLAAAFYAGWSGWKGRVKGVQAADAKNAVIAGDIMDTRPMKDLVVEVSRMNEHLTQLAAAEDRQSAAEDRHSAALDRNTDAMRDLCLSIERKMP